MLPAKSGSVSVAAFCVESGHWHRRVGEDVRSFSCSKSYLATKKLRMAAKLSRIRGEVWRKVAETDGDLGSGFRQWMTTLASGSLISNWSVEIIN